MSEYDKIMEILDAPVICNDGLFHSIDESTKRYLASKICKLEPVSQDILNVTYTTGCEKCGGCYQSSEPFPSHPLCPKCLLKPRADPVLAELWDNDKDVAYDCLMSDASRKRVKVTFWCVSIAVGLVVLVLFVAFVFVLFGFGG